jgi:hypothetical protein
MPKLTIEIDMDKAAFYDQHYATELDRILRTVSRKVENQMAREIGCVCDAPEIDDKLLDINGNTCGSVRLEP